MKIVAKTDIGKKRSSNQDSYASGELPGGVGWAIVCDGMGGAYGGDIASATAVRIISEEMIAAYDSCMGTASIRQMLCEAIQNANDKLYEMAGANPIFNGMGTTVVVTVMDRENAYIAHAGDSRAYLLRAGTIRQITKDHSVVQEMVESGQLSPEMAVSHPNKNLITRAVGAEPQIKAAFTSLPLEAGDAVLMCTDGLTNFVSDAEILRIVSDGGYYDTAERLVALANENGGGDNITVVILAQ